MNTFWCVLGVLRGMCEYLWVCSEGVDGDVWISIGMCWGVEEDMCIAMCVRWEC